VSTRVNGQNKQHRDTEECADENLTCQHQGGRRPVIFRPLDPVRYRCGAALAAAAAAHKAAAEAAPSFDAAVL